MRLIPSAIPALPKSLKRRSCYLDLSDAWIESSSSLYLNKDSGESFTEVLLSYMTAPHHLTTKTIRREKLRLERLNKCFNLLWAPKLSALDRNLCWNWLKSITRYRAAAASRTRIINLTSRHLSCVYYRSIGLKLVSISSSIVFFEVFRDCASTNIACILISSATWGFSKVSLFLLIELNDKIGFLSLMISCMPCGKCSAYIYYIK